MAGQAACLLCGRDFEARGPGTPRRYCGDCMARVEREAARTLRMKCKECGRAFETAKRSVKYCSEPCRKIGYSSYRRAPRKRPGGPGGGSGGAGGSGTEAKCRSCGKAFAPEWKPGRPRAYCSEACRTEGRRRLYREAMKRYCADPEKRALRAARSYAAAARRRAREREEKGR